MPYIFETEPVLKRQKSPYKVIMLLGASPDRIIRDTSQAFFIGTVRWFMWSSPKCPPTRLVWVEFSEMIVKGRETQSKSNNAADSLINS